MIALAVLVFLPGASPARADASDAVHREWGAFLSRAVQEALASEPSSGHSWGAGSVSKFARRLEKENLDVSLAVYIDAVGWRNPRVPSNVRYALNVYQRTGVLRGFPLRGKSRLAVAKGASTEVLGSYRITPQTDHWGWSWNPLQPLFYRQHHRIAHDRRLQAYLRTVATTGVSAVACSEILQASAAHTLFGRVAILGASVSAEEKAPSPGRLLARHMGVRDGMLRVFARGGAASNKLVPQLGALERMRPTLIVALDLFYHDFKMSLFLTEAKKQYLRRYIDRLHRTGAVVVVGNVPRLVLLRHEHVNEYLASLVREFPNLMLVDVDSLIGSLDEGLPVSHGGRVWLLHKEDVFADRVHPNALGSALMANLLLEELRKAFPDRVPAAAAPLDLKPYLEDYAGVPSTVSDE